MMSTIDEVKIQVERLENTFGKYSDEQRSTIVNHLTHLTPHESQEMVTNFIMTRHKNRKPTPQEIQAGVQGRTKRRSKPISKQTHMDLEAPCPKCVSGQVMCEFEGIKLVVRCDCREGKEPRGFKGQALPMFNDPRIANDITNIHRPMIYQPGQDGTQAMMHWMSTVNIAIDFWENHFNPKPQPEDLPPGF